MLFAGCTNTPTATTPPPTTDTTPDEDQALLSKGELFESVVEADRGDYNAFLYYVAANGTWFHAYANGTVESPAPHGNVVPNIEIAYDNGTTVNETIAIPAEKRPIYVWKVTQNDCETTVYNATTGEIITNFPIPACGVPTHLSPTPTQTT